jgi:3-hydroxyacyl-[acyl-carrier-protein] dehydratase
MRYVLVDRITSLEPGRSLTALKNVSASDGMVTRYGKDLWALPAAMVLESMAQAAGLLAASTIHCGAHPALAKVQPFVAHGYAVPGDQIVLRAELAALHARGCRSHTTATIRSMPLAEATIYLAFITSEGWQRGDCLRTVLAQTFPEWFRAHDGARVSS